MKKLFTLLLAGTLLAPATASTPCPPAEEATGQATHTTCQTGWHANKFSMFIHFGLYSELGGVWEGRPVTRGYSEQIQSFAGIFSDWYGETALRFDPTRFDADEIVALAKEAGMRSIVITTKHHDGFCLFRTATTDYNSYDATPCHRDFVKELSDACQRGGVNFAIYFSLIDWHFPQAYPISSHNCDFITPQHHEYTKRQVTELLTNYGPVSELWFDMGSNTPEQSRELYELVHRLQPDCMVSGRLGNDRYDFAVMADNAYPEGSLQTAWQSAASMFNETWSYRSWQERGDAHTKAMEKLRSLISVVSHGGNFLLNIGPKGDGSVVPFEREVLEEMGAWLKQNGEAIYATEASPFRESFAWGNITRKDNRLYLILSGKCPADKTIRLELPGYALKETQATFAGNLQEKMQKGVFTAQLPDAAFDDRTIHVVTLTLDRPVVAQPAAAGTRTPNYSYSCFDYYSNYRSTVNYEWRIPNRQRTVLELTYTPQELGKEIELTTAGNPGSQTIKLEGGTPVALKTDPKTVWGKRYLCGPGSSLFDAPSTIEATPDKAPVRQGEWQETDNEQQTFPARILETYFVMQEVESPKAQDVLVDVGAGNGIEVYLNGHSVMKHLNPYRCSFRKEQVLLHLEKGTNRIVLRLYNRFEKETGYLLRPSAEQVVYKQTATCIHKERGGQPTLQLTVRQKGLPTQHTDTELHNLQIKVK